MANITLSIPDELREKMKKHKEIKWSEIMRKAIITELKKLEEAELREYALKRLAEEIFEYKESKKFINNYLVVITGDAMVYSKEFDEVLKHIQLKVITNMLLSRSRVHQTLDTIKTVYNYIKMLEKENEKLGYDIIEGKRDAADKITKNWNALNEAYHSLEILLSGYISESAEDRRYLIKKLKDTYESPINNMQKPTYLDIYFKYLSELKKKLEPDC